MCRLQRAGSRIQAAARRGLSTAQSQKRLVRDRGFWSEPGEQAVVPRSRAYLPTSDTLRKAEMISGRELAAAAIVALRQNMAMERQDLVAETARLIGWDRVGEYVAEAIEDAIDRHLGGKTETDQMADLSSSRHHRCDG